MTMERIRVTLGHQGADGGDDGDGGDDADGGDDGDGGDDEDVDGASVITVNERR